MLYTADQARKKVLGGGLDKVTEELEVVEKAIHDALATTKTYCMVKFHVTDETVSKLKELGYNVSLNSSNRCTYVSWMS